MRCPQHAATSRRGFTLVEVLVVILIIAILMALLLPAINAAVIAAKNAQVAAEENNLQTALADFKNKYGEYPPSRIILYNPSAGAAPYAVVADPSGWPTGDTHVADLNQRTVRAMRKYFPKAQSYFPTSGTAVSPDRLVDELDDATANGYVILQGDECLVFFLGGMPVLTGSSTPTSAQTHGLTLAVTGFFKDPVNPFLSTTNVASTNALYNSVSTNRTVPLFEFAPQRLIDLDGDGFASYVDPLSASNTLSGMRPYAYFSAYGNNGYDPNDYNWYDNTQATPVAELDDRQPGLADVLRELRRQQRGRHQPGRDVGRAEPVHRRRRRPGDDDQPDAAEHELRQPADVPDHLGRPRRPLGPGRGLRRQLEREPAAGLHRRPAVVRGGRPQDRARQRHQLRRRPARLSRPRAAYVNRPRASRRGAGPGIEPTDGVSGSGSRPCATHRPRRPDRGEASH